MVADIDVQGGRRTVEEIHVASGSAELVATDVADDGLVAAPVATTLVRQGRIDVLRLDPAALADETALGEVLAHTLAHRCPGLTGLQLSLETVHPSR